MDKKDEICTSKAPNRLKSRRKTHLVAIVVRCYVFKLTDYFKYRYRDVFWLNLDLIALKWKQKRCFVIKNAIKFIHGGARTEVPRVRLPKRRSGVRKNTTIGHLFVPPQTYKTNQQSPFLSNGSIFLDFGPSFFRSRFLDGFFIDLGWISAPFLHHFSMIFRYFERRRFERDFWSNFWWK